MASIHPLDIDAIREEAGEQTGHAIYTLWRIFNEVLGRDNPVTESSDTLAGQPSLGIGDVGFIFNVTDYGHRVRWTGSVWEFAPGDPGNDFIALCHGVPQGNGWQLCDGTATDYLTVGGASLTATAFTTPNINGTASYAKMGSAYAGIAAAVAPTVSGSTANESSHTHPVNPPDTNLTYDDTSFDTNLDGSFAPALSDVGALMTPHTDVASFTSGAGSAHGHGAGSLAVSATSEPSRVTLLPYYRR